MKYSLGAVAVAIGAAMLASGMASLRETDEESAPGAASKAVMSVRSAPERTEPRGVAEVRLLGVNDLHGHLESPGSMDGRPVGGFTHVAAHLAGTRPRTPYGFMRGTWSGRRRSRRTISTTSRPSRR
ncbi:MAG: hypothetical protein H0U65_13930 [Rubrobacter sp.]|nr:hypothetical protein [Rubrobacter sp.]